MSFPITPAHRAELVAKFQPQQPVLTLSEETLQLAIGKDDVDVISKLLDENLCSNLQAMSMSENRNNSMSFQTNSALLHPAALIDRCCESGAKSILAFLLNDGRLNVATAPPPSAFGMQSPQPTTYSALPTNNNGSIGPTYDRPPPITTINQPNCNVTAIPIATRNGFYQLVEMLLADDRFACAREVINDRYALGQVFASFTHSGLSSPLLLAVGRNDATLVQLFLRDRRIGRAERREALIVASEKGYCEIVESICEAVVTSAAARLLYDDASEDSSSSDDLDEFDEVQDVRANSKKRKDFGAIESDEDSYEKARKGDAPNNDAYLEMVDEFFEEDTYLDDSDIEEDELEQFAIDDFSDALLRASTEGHVQVVQYFLALSAKLRQLSGQSKPEPLPRPKRHLDNSAAYRNRHGTPQNKAHWQQFQRKQRERQRRLLKREKKRDKRRKATELILDEEDLSAALAYACMNGHLLVVEMLILHVRAISMDEFLGSQSQDSMKTDNNDLASGSLADVSMQEMLLEGLQYACQCGHSRVVSALLPYLKLAPRKKLKINLSGQKLGLLAPNAASSVFSTDCDARDMRPRKFFVNNERNSTPKEVVDEVDAMEEELKVEAKELESEANEDSTRHRSLLMACLETAYRHDHWTCFQAIVSLNGTQFQFSMDEILFPDDDPNDVQQQSFGFTYTSRFSADYLAQVFYIPYTIAYVPSNSTRSKSRKPSFLPSDSDSLDIDEPEWKRETLQRERIRSNRNPTSAELSSEYHSARMMCVKYDDYLDNENENSYDDWQDLLSPEDYETKDFQF